MIRKLIVVTLLAISSVACESESESISGENKLVAFKPNQCSEAWDGEKYTADANLSRADRLKNYLKDNGITSVANFEVTTDNNIYCAACTCPSNDNIKFNVSNADFEKLKTIVPFSTYLK
jgi:hypothetical protein